MVRAFTHLVLCGFALVQLGAVPPCLLDETLAAVVGDAEGNRLAPGGNESQPRIYYDEDAGDPRFAGIRATVVESQGHAAPARQALAYPYVLPALPRVLETSRGHLAFHPFHDSGPPPGQAPAFNLPLLL